MIDFSTVTSMVIPEGNVMKIEIGGIEVFNAARHRYIITFNANGGSGSMANQVVRCVDASIQVNIDSLSFSPAAGHYFTGWNTKADGSGTTYSDGQAITLTGDVVLYAQWAINMYTVTYTHSQGDVIQNGKDQTGPMECYALFIDGVEQGDLGAFSNPSREYNLPYGTRIKVVAEVDSGDDRSYVSWNGTKVANNSSSASYEFNLSENIRIDFEWNQWLSDWTIQSYWNCYIETF